MSDAIKICEQAARLGGAELLRWKGKFSITEKAVADLVTEADFASQLAIFEFLKGEFPDHGFLGEETLGDLKNTKADLCQEHVWVVDPLDGTTNYVHGLPYYCVSVALVCRGKSIAGTVFDPERDECFSAASDRETTCNGQPIRTSGAQHVEDSLLVTGFGPGARVPSPEIDWLVHIMPRAQSIRRMGAAALNLAYLAAGRVDGYWQSTAKAWDVAAGELLVRQAGGTVTSLDGGAFELTDPKLVAAATDTLNGEIVDLLRHPTKA